MDCREFMEELEAFLGGEVSPQGRRSALRHLRACSDCRELTRVLQEGTAAGSVQPGPDLTREVLLATSGSPCGSARERLGEFTDHTLEPLDAELVSRHLAGCEDCRSLSRVLARMSEDLPLLAELAPDARLVDDVLAGTVRRRRPVAGWAARLAETWDRLARRPRLAWEGAFIGTCLFVLLFGIPTSPLAGVPRQAIHLIRIDPRDSLHAPLNRVQGSVSVRVEEARDAWNSFEEKVAATSRKVKGEVTRKTADTWEKINGYLGTIVGPDASLPETNETERTPQEGEGTEGEQK